MHLVFYDIIARVVLINTNFSYPADFRYAILNLNHANSLDMDGSGRNLIQIGPLKVNVFKIGSSPGPISSRCYKSYYSHIPLRRIPLRRTPLCRTPYAVRHTLLAVA